MGITSLNCSGSPELLWPAPADTVLPHRSAGLVMGGFEVSWPDATTALTQAQVRAAR